jgi:hypothetical protein
MSRQLERIQVLRDSEHQKDIYEYDYTDITRKGDAIIHKRKESQMYF